MTNYLYDSNHTRYELYQSNGGDPYNWVFLPGGPGVDSSYFRSLVDILDLPGNVWLVDFPENGDNVNGTSEEYDFDKWLDIFVPYLEASRVFGDKRIIPVAINDWDCTSLFKDKRNSTDEIRITDVIDVCNALYTSGVKTCQ